MYIKSETAFFVVVIKKSKLSSWHSEEILVFLIAQYTVLGRCLVL